MGSIGLAAPSDKEMTKIRLMLVFAVKNVLAEVFKLLKITAPEKM